MPYTNDQYRVTVEGNLGSGETFSNTWTFIDDTTGQDVQNAVDLLHDFYGTWDQWIDNSASATMARARNLGTNVETIMGWTAVPGTNTNELLPTQLAVRVSLNTASGLNGGPFLAGWSSQTVTTGGLCITDVQDDVLAGMEALNAALQSAGWRIGIDRPTVPQVSPATRVRIGRRFDVIRKRANDLSESYVSADIS